MTKNTAKKSGTKSIVSPTQNNFWDFYLDNQTWIDRTIQRFGRRFDMEFDDLKSEVLIRLHKSDVLSQYDPSRGAINTFITSRIHGYVLHTVVAQMHHIHGVTGWVSILTDAKKWKENWTKEDTNGLYISRALDKELNGGTEGSLRLSSQDDSLENLCATDLTNIILENLNGVRRKIFEMKIQGLSNTDIAFAIKKSPQYVNWAFGEIKDTVLKILEL